MLEFDHPGTLKALSERLRDVVERDNGPQDRPDLRCFFSEFVQQGCAPFYITDIQEINDTPVAWAQEDRAVLKDDLGPVIQKPTLRAADELASGDFDFMPG